MKEMWDSIQLNDYLAHEEYKALFKELRQTRDELSAAKRELEQTKISYREYRKRASRQQYGSTATYEPSKQWQLTQRNGKTFFE